MGPAKQHTDHIKIEGDTFAIATGVYDYLHDDFIRALESLGYTPEETLTCAEVEMLPENLEGLLEPQKPLLQEIRPFVTNGGGILIASASFGKSFLMGTLFRQVKGNILVMVDTRDLAHQLRGDLIKSAKEPVGIYGDGQVDNQRINVAIVDSLYAFRYAELRHPSLMVIDELHVHLNSQTFAVLNYYEPKSVIGVTATLDMTKESVYMPAYSICGYPVAKYTVKQAMDDGLVTKTHLVTISCPKPSEVYGDNVGPTEIYEKEVAQDLWSNTFIARLLVRADQDKHVTGVFVSLRKHVDELKIALNDDYDNKSRVLEHSGRQSASLRRYIRDSVAETKSGITVATEHTLGKGMSVHPLSFFVDACQKKSWSGAAQKHGRLLRKCEGKDYAIYVDFGYVNSNDRYGFGKAYTAKATEERRLNIRLQYGLTPTLDIKLDRRKTPEEEAERAYAILAELS
jgi:superfamily II DNA or RNA helicase